MKTAKIVLKSILIISLLLNSAEQGYALRPTAVKSSSAASAKEQILKQLISGLLRQKVKESEVVEVNPANGIKCVKEKDLRTGKYRHKSYIYPEAKSKLSRVEFEYDRNGKVERLSLSPNKGADLKDIGVFSVSRDFTFSSVSDPELSSSGYEWAVMHLEEGSDINRIYRFSVRLFDKEGCLKEEKSYTFGLEAGAKENLLSFAGIYSGNFHFAQAVACELLESVFKAVGSGRTLQEGLPENSLLSALGGIQKLGQVDKKTYRDLRELRWVDSHQDPDGEIKAEERYVDALSLLTALPGALFKSACHDKAKVRYFLRAVRTVSGDWAANVLLDPRELHLTLPKNPKAQMALTPEISKAIKGELWKRRGRRTRYDKFLLQFLFFWALEGDTDFIIKLIRNIEGDSASLKNVRLTEGRFHESWENILYLYAFLAQVSGIFGVNDLSKESVDFLFARLGEFLEQTKDKDRTGDDSLLRGTGKNVQNIIGMLVHTKDKRLYEYLITLAGHPLEPYMSEDYPDLPVDFLASGLGSAYPLLEKEKDKQREVIDILIKRLEHSNVWRALAAAQELVRIKGPACANALLESYERLSARLDDKGVAVLNKICAGLRNHRTLPVTLALVSEEEASLAGSNLDIMSRDIDFQEQIGKIRLEHLGILRFIKAEVAETLPDAVIEELADNFIYPDEAYRAENRPRVVELLRKFAYTESGFDEYVTIYYLYKIRPIAGRIRADLFIERFPEISRVVKGEHAFIGPIFSNLFGVNGRGRPIIPQSRFHSQVVHMQQRMGTKERPGLSQIADKVRNFGTNWPVLSAVASQMLLRGNIKEPVYRLGREVLGKFEGSHIDYQPFVTLNNPGLVRTAYAAVVSTLGGNEKTRFGSHLRNELGHSLGELRTRPELFNIYADEIAAILSEFPFADGGRVQGIISDLIFPRRQGIEFRYMRRGFEDFRLGDLVGDCTEISGTNFWSVPTFLAHPFYQTMLIYYDGQLVDKVDFTLVEKEGALYLAIDAHEPVPQLDEKNISASPTLINKREEIYLATINKIREIAKAVGAAGIRAQGVSNRAYIEGEWRLLVDRSTGEERKLALVKPGLYEKYFGKKKDQETMVRLLGGLDVVGRFVASAEEQAAPILQPLLTFKEGKPQILFQTAKSLVGRDKMLQLFGRTLERHLAMVRAKSRGPASQYAYKELDKAISELEFQKAAELICRKEDRPYKELRKFIEQQLDNVYTEIGKLPGPLEEKMLSVLELTFGPSRIEGCVELYEIPLEPTESAKSSSAGKGKIELARGHKELKEALPIFANQVLTKLSMEIMLDKSHRSISDKVRRHFSVDFVESEINSIVLIGKVGGPVFGIVAKLPRALKVLSKDPDLYIQALWFHFQQQDMVELVRETIRCNKNKEQEESWQVDAKLRAKDVAGLIDKARKKPLEKDPLRPRMIVTSEAVTAEEISMVKGVAEAIGNMISRSPNKRLAGIGKMLMLNAVTGKPTPALEAKITDQIGSAA